MDDIVDDGNRNLQNENNLRRLLSLGYAEDRAIATAIAQTRLQNRTSEVARCKQIPEEDLDIRITRLAIPGEENLLLDDALIPEWQNFAAALASAPAHKQGYICLTLIEVNLQGGTRDILLRAFKDAPLKELSVYANGQRSNDLSFMINAVQRSKTIESVEFYSSPIESEEDATSLVEAIAQHQKVRSLFLRACGIGQSNAVLSGILPALNIDGLRLVQLRENNIGSHGAAVITSCLASNPAVRALDLRDNLLGDDDVEKLSLSLKTNTNLRFLKLAGNPITELSSEYLLRVLYDLTSLNAVHDGNHTAWVADMLEKINQNDDPKMNRDVKIMSALRPCDDEYSNIHDDMKQNVPIKVIPRVLSFIQGGGPFYLELTPLFRFLRAWNMPCLYTSRIGPEPRRSERTRKRKVDELLRAANAQKK